VTFSPTTAAVTLSVTFACCIAASAACLPEAAQENAAAARSVAPLQISGTAFRTAEHQPFQWRGITAFRLLDHVADGHYSRVNEYLAWAARQKLTVVRVLAMAGAFMNLNPEEGRAALPRLLEFAARHGIYVEVVALAGTRDIPVDLATQVSAIGRIVSEHPNGLLEVANEPVHPSQAPDVHKAEVLARLASQVPKRVPVSLGSVERGDGFANGSYITWHVPRDDRFGGWGHVLAIAEGDRFLQRWRKPVISDEPIGAGPKYELGRRDDVPARFRAAALLTRLVGLGATFHYEGGLQATIPAGRELECFNAWNEAWTLLPRDIEQQGSFRTAGEAGGIVESYDKNAVLGVYERNTNDRGWILSVGDGDPRLRLAAGWRETRSQVLEGARLISVTRLTK
jgi:hypothetical protein